MNDVEFADVVLVDEVEVLEYDVDVEDVDVEHVLADEGVNLKREADEVREEDVEVQVLVELLQLVVGEALKV